MVAKLAVDEKRQTPVELGIDIASRVISLQEIDRTAGRIFRDGHVGHPDIEPVVRFEFEIAQVEFASAFIVHHCDFDRVCAIGENFLGDKFTVFVHRHWPTGNPHLVFVRYAAATNADRAAAETDIVHRQIVFAVA